MSELNLKCPADFQGGIQDDWDNDYASMWAQVQSLSHNKMQYRKAWITAKDEITRLQSEVERLRGRCGELEISQSALKALADTMDAAIEADANAVNDLQDQHATKLLFSAHEAYLIYKEGVLGKASDAVILRKQAEAVEAVAEELQQSDRYGKKEFRRGMATAYGYATGYAQRLRQQADDLDNV